METEVFILTIVGSVFASTGFWGLITYLIQRHDRNESAERLMLKGIGHDRICYLGEHYLKRGFITKDEYENLHDYLYEPYVKLGGNGTAKKIMDDVSRLPIKDKHENCKGSECENVRRVSA